MPYCVCSRMFNWGIGIRVLDYYWLVGGYLSPNVAPVLDFLRHSIMWKISKHTWVQGPDLPFLKGIENGCATHIGKTKRRMYCISGTNLRYN